LGKKLARRITPPCDYCSGAEVDGADTTCTDPDLVIKIPRVRPAPVPCSRDPPFTFGFSFKAIDPGPIDILRACWPGFTIIIDTRSGIVVIVVAAVVLDEEGVEMGRRRVWRHRKRHPDHAKEMWRRKRATLLTLCCSGGGRGPEDLVLAQYLAQS
jgi:hypothetical protein